GSVFTPRHDAPPLGREAGGEEAPLVPLQGEHLSPADRIPHLRALVPTRRHDPLPIGREADRGDLTGMSLKDTGFLPAGRVPHLRRAVWTPHHNTLLIGREVGAPDQAARMHGMDLSPARRLP